MEGMSLTAARLCETACCNLSFYNPRAHEPLPDRQGFYIDCLLRAVTQDAIVTKKAPAESVRLWPGLKAEYLPMFEETCAWAICVKVRF